MTNTIHESLTSTEDSSIKIETSADVIKPIMAYGSKLVGEYNVHFNNGIQYDAVDPANVAMVGLNAPSEVFETYDVESGVVGLDTSEIMGAMRAGRQKDSDPITLSKQGDRLSTVVSRDYSGTEMDLQNKIRIIDPDSIRQEPDVPDLELPAEATIPRKLFEDAVDGIKQSSDQLRFTTDGGALMLGDNNGNVNAVIDGVSNGEEADSILSMDYVKSELVKSIKAIGVDEITIKMGVEFPVRFEWEKELNGETVSGYWFQAPRIQSE